MPSKIVLTVTKGEMAGTSFSYQSKESLVLGRQEDCSVVLPEGTVSRYHCIIDIAPPSVMVRDFKSLNGTYLNGQKIGQRDEGMSADQAREFRGEEFPMKSGDRLGLGKDCELSLEVKLPQYCADCYEEVEGSEFKNPEGLIICADCHQKRIDVKTIGQVSEEKHSRQICEICGETLYGAETPGICETCQKNPIKVLQFLLSQAGKGIGDAKEIAGYRNLSMLGQGGMGQVWLVEEEQTGKQMALKLMLPKAAADQNSRELFLREAYVAGQLCHRNIVRQYKCGQSGDTYFILMEYCDGGSLDAFIEKNGGRLSVDLATNILFQVLDAFIYAHEAVVSVKLKNGELITSNGIVHRDFKPGNIFLTGEGKNMVAKVADFGLAKGFEAAGLTGHTRTGQLAGTPVFMPRQQIINFRYAKPPVDVWAAAASYYFMLTGKYPKEFTRGKDVIATALNNPAVPILKRNPNLPKNLAAVIDQALLEKPDIGVKSAAQLKKMIEDVL